MFACLPSLCCAKGCFTSGWAYQTRCNRFNGDWTRNSISERQTSNLKFGGAVTSYLICFQDFKKLLSVTKPVRMNDLSESRLKAKHLSWFCNSSIGCGVTAESCRCGDAARNNLLHIILCSSLLAERQFGSLNTVRSGDPQEVISHLLGDQWPGTPSLIGYKQIIRSSQQLYREHTRIFFFFRLMMRHAWFLTTLVTLGVKEQTRWLFL